MTPDVPPPGERWCRVCHRLESEVEFHKRDGRVCMPCRHIIDAFRYYWRVWEWERRQARNQARRLAA